MLEAGGAANPTGLFMTFNDPNLCNRVRLDSATCAVGADQVFACSEYPEL